MLETDADLDTLIQQKDDLNVLRYLRVHKIRDPRLVLSHGYALLGKELNRKSTDELTLLSILEQICLAALDVGNHEAAQLCLDRLKQFGGISSDGYRFRLLLGRCMEAGNDLAGALTIYDNILKENPTNLLALKRKYCLLKAQVGKEILAMESLNAYLKQDSANSAGWYELYKFRLELGDFHGAAFALEEVLLTAPTDVKIHCELAECYSTIGGLDCMGLARKHFAQALELDSTSRRAQFGLVSAANAYLLLGEGLKDKKGDDAFELEVAKELVTYGCEQILKSYSQSTMLTAVKALMEEYGPTP